MYLSNKYIFDGKFGIERETLRVTSKGRLARTPHPFEDNEYIDRDFCENQLEIMTPVRPSIDELMGSLRDLDENVKSALSPRGEYMWMCSNPPRIKSENEIPIANYFGIKAFKHNYRINLERRYGKRLMLYSGIHFNFSFSEKFFQSLYGETENYKNLRDDFYFRLSKQAHRYGWLLVLLTAASPVYDLSLDGDGLSGSGFKGYSSMRCGAEGYWNQFIPILDYTNIETYIESVNEYVNKGMLFSPGELYLPVRLKSKPGADLNSVANWGVDHIELRMFDLNPLSPLGIFPEDLRFAHYFLIFLAEFSDFEFTPKLQEKAIENFKNAAKYDISEIKIDGCSAYDKALEILDDMADYFGDYEDVLQTIDCQRDKILKNTRYCLKVYEMLIDDFQNKMLNLTKSYGGVSDV